MKLYAVGPDNNCVELSFASEDDADMAFNQAEKDRKGFSEVKDMTGKKKVVNTFCGYSSSKGDIFCLLEKK